MLSVRRQACHCGSRLVQVLGPVKELANLFSKPLAFKELTREARRAMASPTKAQENGLTAAETEFMVRLSEVAGSVDGAGKPSRCWGCRGSLLPLGATRQHDISTTTPGSSFFSRPPTHTVYRPPPHTPQHTHTHTAATHSRRRR